jgi:hypothetical protein
MEPTRPDLVDVLITKEIERMVAAAAVDSSSVSATATIAAVKKIYRSNALSERELLARVLIAATQKGLAVEFGENDELAWRRA